MGSPRVEEILEALGWLALTPGERRKAKPPDLTPLSDAETAAVREALEAAELGIDVPTILVLERHVEKMLQTPEDRRRGRIAPPEHLPPLLEILRRDPFALHGARFRAEFFVWLWTKATDREARNVLRILRSRDPIRDADSERTKLAVGVYTRVKILRDSGLSRSEAIRKLAATESITPCGARDCTGLAAERPDPEMSALEARNRAFSEAAIELSAAARLSPSEIESLLRTAETFLRVPPQRAPHKRPGRNKRGTPGNPAYSGPKATQKAGLSTLSPRRSTDAEGKRDDELPHDNRSRRPAQGAAPNPPGVEAQREGAAILEAVRKPRSVRGRGAVAVPRGTDVRSHGRGDDSARKRPGRVKGPP
jgi:hypothetical protein